MNQLNRTYKWSSVRNHELTVRLTHDAVMVDPEIHADREIKIYSERSSLKLFNHKNQIISLLLLLKL